MKLSEKKKSYIYLAAMAFVLLLLLGCELFRKAIFGGQDSSTELYEMTTRALGGILCAVLIFYCSYQNIFKIKQKDLGRAVLFTLPCWAIAINNFPIIPYLSGKVYIEADTSDILFYALQCLCVGFFEELAFRGCIFLLALQRRRQTVWGAFSAIVISSAVFGAIHLVNILAGASPVAVILQVGYSFLIGGMCAVVLMRTHCIWHCVLLHAVYNFCGGVVPRFGGGEIWTVPEIILTVAVSLAVCTYVVISLLRMDTSKLDAIFEKKKKKIETE
jgi:membrane protease YdiL (CAAX protease family)